MKITIEYNEEKVTQSEAVTMTKEALTDPGINGKIKDGKNVKLVWHSKACAVLTQQGTHMVVLREVVSNG